MKRYEPAATVLPEYTDEALRSEAFYKGDVAALLLTVPAEFRQPVEVEANRRTRRIVDTPYGLKVECTGNIHEARRQIVAEVLAQLGRVTS